MFGDFIQPWHLIVILVIVLIIFGPGKLSGVGSALGKTIRDFRTSVSEDESATRVTHPTDTVIKTPSMSDSKTTTTVVTSEPSVNNSHISS